MSDFEPLPPQALTVMRLRLLVPAGLSALLAVAGSVAMFLTDVDGASVFGAVLAGLVVLILIAWWVFSGMVFHAYGWLLTDATVELRHGVIVRRHQVLPRARVQNVTKEAGPVSRVLGLASITVHSAGANTPNITVPDLTVEAGDWLRTSLLPTTQTNRR